VPHAEKPINMKNIVLFLTLSSSLLMAQFSYPLEDFLGGGIGYSPMYIKLDSIPGSSDLMGLGLNPKDFRDPFVIHGGEGFAHVTGRWRIGGYAGAGGTSISTVPDIIIFQDDNGNDSLDAGENSKDYTSSLVQRLKQNSQFLWALHLSNTLCLFYRILNYQLGL